LDEKDLNTGKMVINCEQWPHLIGLLLTSQRFVGQHYPKTVPAVDQH